MKTIAVDFDGVIHAYSAGWHDGTCYDVPVQGAIIALKKLMKRHAVFVFSTRDPDQIIEWFARMKAAGLSDIEPPTKIAEGTYFWNGSGLGVSNRKIAAIAYIDDRGLRFTNWQDMTNYFT
jgi:hypothetical protein